MLNFVPWGVNIFYYLNMGQLANAGESQPAHGKIEDGALNFLVL